ncbi:MAG TPA: phosphate ABC transporter permease PstA [Caulobacter sp.]|nr:phosphate ABC transporter permease PstA [Caulobacter sp.]
MPLDRRLRRNLANGLFVAACGTATLVALLALGMIMASLAHQGLAGLSVDIFTRSTPAPGSQGGLLNAITGSLMMCGLAMAIAVAVGLLAGTWLAEFGGKSAFAHTVRFLNDVLLSAPSILIGLFVYELVVRPLHGFSGFAGAVALALIAAPVVTRTTEDILRLQPSALREAGAALGAARWITIRKIIWPGAGAGLLTGALLAFARISGETAPLLFTALNNQFLNLDMGKPMASLPAVIFQFALSAYDDWRSLAWTGALLIALAVLFVNIIGRVIAARGIYRP